MTPEQKIKHAILICDLESRNRWSDEQDTLPEITAENVDQVYADLDEESDGALADSANEIREGEVETGLPCQDSRHYESKSVAAKMPDGSWVGWTYWYGGGKHGEPEAIDWMDEAYDLDVTEEEKVVTVRTFARQAAAESSK